MVHNFASFSTHISSGKIILYYFAPVNHLVHNGPNVMERIRMVQIFAIFFWICHKTYRPLLLVLTTWEFKVNTVAGARSNYHS